MPFFSPRSPLSTAGIALGGVPPIGTQVVHNNSSGLRVAKGSGTAQAAVVPGTEGIGLPLAGKKLFISPVYQDKERPEFCSIGRSTA
jgi:hypothetical protein